MTATWSLKSRSGLDRQGRCGVGDVEVDAHGAEHFLGWRIRSYRATRAAKAVDATHMAEAASATVGA